MICTLECSHWFCCECVEAHLKEQIINSAFERLKCPQIGCEIPISEEKLREVASEPLVQKYYAFKENQRVNMDEHSFWCPNVRCAKAIDTRRFSGKKGVCPSCGTEVCLSCHKLYHGSKDCLQEIDDVFRKWAARKDVNPCPKCKVPVEKAAGC